MTVGQYGLEAFALSPVRVKGRMLGPDPVVVRAALQDFLASQHGGRRIDAAELPDDLDMLASGMIDSLGFLGLMTMMRQAFGEHIDFEGLDPDQMGIVGPFCDFVAASSAGG